MILIVHIPRTGDAFCSCKEHGEYIEGVPLTDHINQMKFLNALAASILLGTLITSINPSQARSNQHTCFTQYDEGPGPYTNCDATFRSGRVISIKDISSGVTFRAGENGWIPATGNCLQNLESGTKICISN